METNEETTAAEEKAAAPGESNPPVEVAQAEVQATDGSATNQKPIDRDELEQEIIKVLKTVYDPEIPVNIYEMGLIYNMAISEDGVVDVKMTLTSPACPVAGTLPPEVQMKIGQVPGVKEARIDLVWDPPWDMTRMTEAARLQLGMF